MATAYFCDGIDARFRETIGSFDTLAQAKQACIDHAKKHRFFVAILTADDDGEQGFDMAVQISHDIRLYSADA